MRHTIYKWTHANMQTLHGYQWEVGKEHRRPGRERDLCNSDWLHAYTSPRLAVLLDPAHGHYTFNPRPRLWVGEGWGRYIGDGTKVGYSRMRLLEEVPAPKYTDIQRVYVALRCAIAVCDAPTWREWATGWGQGWRVPCPVNLDDLYLPYGPTAYRTLTDTLTCVSYMMEPTLCNRERVIWSTAAGAAVFAQRNLNGSLALDEIAKDALEYRG